MTKPEDAHAWFDAIFADPLNGVLTLIAVLCLVFLFKVASNLADPSKWSRGLVAGTALAIIVLAFSLWGVFLKDNDTPNCEPTIDTMLGGDCP